MNYTPRQWADHYTRRAASAQHDANAARRAGKDNDASVLDSVAAGYRLEAAAARIKEA